VKVRADVDEGPLTMDDLRLAASDWRMEVWKAEAFERGSVCTLERLHVCRLGGGEYRVEFGYCVCSLLLYKALNVWGF
jgi:hypothetical protein